MSAALECTIARIIHEYDLVEPGSTVITAVSGGPDSMALLHLLAALRQRLSCRLVAVYVDHGLRPDEVLAEIACVRRAADALSLPCDIVPVTTREFAVKEKMSIEHAARDLRYQALRSCAEKYGAKRIAVAHTADDQAEEILLRLLRGSGRKGLAGMRLLSKDVVRPLLSTTKRQVLEYLDRRKIAFCHDSSNDDLRYLRNRVRHVLLPLLEKEFDQGIRSALLKTAGNLSEDEDFFHGLVDDACRQLVEARTDEKGEQFYMLDRPGFVGLHSCLQRRLVERLLWSIGCPARYSYIIDIQDAAVAGRNGSELHLHRGLRVGVTGEMLQFFYPRGKTAWRGNLRGPGKQYGKDQQPGNSGENKKIWT